MSSRGSYLGSSAIFSQTIASDSLAAASKHRLLFASEYYYKRDGLEHIQNSFKNQLSQLGAQDLSVDLNYDQQNKTFHIACDPGKSKIVWKIFHTILTTMVHDECKKSALIHKNENDLDSSDEDMSSDEDESEFDEDLVLISDKIGRLEVSEPHATNSHVSVILPELEDMPTQVRDLNFRHTFNLDDAIFCMDKVFTDSILKELARVTNSTFVCEPNKNRIFIGNNTEKSLVATISKMNNLKNYHNIPKTFVHHSLYSESDTNVQFSFLKLSNMKNRYFKTTILNNFTFPNNSDRSKEFAGLLEEGTTVRSASFDRESATYRILWGLKITPAIKREDITVEQRAWEKSKYPARGTRKDMYEIFRKIQSYSDKTTTAKHSKIPASHSHAPKSKEDAGPLISNWVQDVVQSSSTRDDQSNEFALTQREVPKNGIQKPVWDPFQDIKPSKLDEVPQAKPDLKKLRPSLKLTRNSPSQVPTDTRNAATSETSSDFWSRYNNKASVYPIGVASKQIVEPKKVEMLPEKSDQWLRTQSLLDDSTSHFHWEVLTPKKNETKKPEKKKKAKEDTGQADEALKKCSQSELSSKQTARGSAISETKSTRPKILLARRRLQNSPQITKECPKKDPSLTHTQTENQISENFNEDICSAFRSLMEKVRTSSEEAVIEANFGRIIIHGINNAYVTNKGDTERTYEEARTRGILMDAGINNIPPSFTKVVTTTPAEIRYMSEVKDKHGNQYWTRIEDEIPLHYELYFLDKVATAKNMIVVEIHAENYTLKIKTLSELANVYVHGSKRFWDFRISATGTGNKKQLEIVHSELLAMISSSLFIPDNSSKPNLTFEIKHPICDRYFLDRAVIRHVDKYSSRDNESILHISEVQTLDILVREYPEKKSSIFHTYVCQEDKDYQHKLRFWSEVSISSKIIDEEISKYSDLELGDLPGWYTNSLESSYSPRSIYVPACWMLEIFDGIGNYNDNGLEIGKSAPIRTSLHQSTAPVYYW